MPATTSDVRERRTGDADSTGGTLPAVSVVVPCKDEAGNVSRLVEEIAAALAEGQFEVVVVDDGSTDGTAQAVLELATGRSWLRLVSHERSAGQSFAIRTGVLAARGPVVVTIDGDGQNDPAYIPAMLDLMRTGGASLALVAGQRTGRKSSVLKRLASRFANGLRQAILKDGTRDTGCGLKAMRREVFLRLPYFDGWHRYLPALVRREGYEVGFVDVVDRQREHGQSKYGIIDRGLVGILDLFGVWWLLRRGRRWSTGVERRPR